MKHGVFGTTAFLLLVSFAFIGSFSVFPGWIVAQLLGLIQHSAGTVPAPVSPLNTLGTGVLSVITFLGVYIFASFVSRSVNKKKVSLPSQGEPSKIK
jgi:hypothetical protein